MKMEAEVGVLYVQNKGLQELQAARRRSQNRFFLRAFRRHHPIVTLISVLYLPELRQNKFLL
jgi:hypothetical protein